MTRMLSTKGVPPYPKFLVLGCNGYFEIVDHAFSLPEATIRAEKEDACFVLKILRIKEGVNLGIFDIEEVPVPVAPVSPPKEDVPPVRAPVRVPMPTRGSRPPPVELL